MSVVSGIVVDVFVEFLDRLIAAFPRLLSALTFLVLAYLTIRVVLALARRSLYRLYPGDQTLVADLFVTILAVFLWFGAALTFMRIVGMGEIAASLGTAMGFIALGISYALSEMIEDTVAGVYLLRDPDFNVGYRVEAGGVTGTVAAIELRKSRIDADDGDRVVLANRSIEGKWTRLGSDDDTGA